MLDKIRTKSHTEDYKGVAKDAEVVQDERHTQGNEYLRRGGRSQARLEFGNDTASRHGVTIMKTWLLVRLS